MRTANLLPSPDQAHRDARDVVLQRDAGVGIERQPPQTGSHRAQPFDSQISETTRIVYWNSVRGRAVLQGALRETAVADFTTLGEPTRPVSPVANGGML